jgi:hypothetical protein
MPPAPVPAPVTREDITDLALALPEVSDVGSGEHPAYAVGGKKFVTWRGLRPDAIDPETGPG